MEKKMKKLLELITEEFEKAFEQCGYDKKLGKVGVSNSTSVTELWQEQSYITRHQL